MNAESPSWPEVEENLADKFADSVAKRLLQRWQLTQVRLHNQIKAAEKRDATLRSEYWRPTVPPELHEILTCLQRDPELIDKCLSWIRANSTTS